MAESRIESLKQLLEKNPNDSFPRYALALEYKALGRLQTAVRCLKEVIERDGNYIAAYRRLGQMNSMLNLSQEAKLNYRPGITVAEAFGDPHAKDLCLNRNEPCRGSLELFVHVSRSKM